VKEQTACLVEGNWLLDISPFTQVATRIFFSLLLKVNPGGVIIFLFDAKQ